MHDHDSPPPSWYDEPPGYFEGPDPEPRGCLSCDREAPLPDRSLCERCQQELDEGNLALAEELAQVIADRDRLRALLQVAVLLIEEGYPWSSRRPEADRTLSVLRQALEVPRG